MRMHMIAGSLRHELSAQKAQDSSCDDGVDASPGNGSRALPQRQPPHLGPLTAGDAGQGGDLAGRVEELQASLQRVGGIATAAHGELAAQRDAAQRKARQLQVGVGGAEPSLAAGSGRAAHATLQDGAVSAAQRWQHCPSLQARVMQLEGTLLNGACSTVRNAAAAAAATAPRSPRLLAGGSGDCSSASSSAGQLRQALQEITALTRARDAAQREAALLQQRLSDAERNAQAAAAAAAAERARAVRAEATAEARSTALKQKLEALIAREQRTAARLAEVLRQGSAP